MPVPLRDVITYAVGAVMAIFAANQALHSSGMMSLYTLPGLNPIRDYLPAYEPTIPLDTTTPLEPTILLDSSVPLELTTPENEPSKHGTIELEPTIPLDTTTPLEPTILLDSSVPLEFTTPENEPSKHGTVELKPTIPPASTILLEPTITENEPLKHGTFTPVDEAGSPEDKKHTPERCSTLCQFMRTYQKLLVNCAIISRKWSSFVMQNVDKVIDFRTQEPISAGLVGFIMTFIIMGSSSSTPRVAVDKPVKDYGASDVYAGIQVQARKTEKQIAVAEITKLWNANTRLTAENVTFQRQLRVKTQEASEQKSTVESIRTALSTKTEEYCSAKTSLDNLHESNNMLSLEKNKLSQQLQGKTDECSEQKSTIESIRAVLSTKTEEHRSAKTSLNDLHESNNMLSLDKNKLSQQLQNKIDECSTMVTTLANTNDRFNNLQKSHTELGVQHDQTINTLATTNDDLGALRRDNDNLRKNSAEVERNLESITNKLSKAEASLERCELEKSHANERLAIEVGASKKACDFRDDRITELGAFLELGKKKYANERQQFQTRIANLERLNEDQVASLKQLAQTLSTLGETLDLIKRENGSLQISLSENQDLLEKVKTDSQQQQATTREGNLHLEGLCREATAQVAALHLELAAKGDEIKKLAEDKEAEKSHLEGLHREATAQVAELRLELAAKGDEIKKLVEEKDTELAIYRQKTADLRRNLKNAKKEATVATEATSADSPLPAEKADRPDDDEEGEGDDNGKATASEVIKRRRKRKHAGRNPTSAATPPDDDDPSAPSAGQAGIVAQ